MSWDILPKGNLQYFLTKLKGELDFLTTETDTTNNTPYLYRASQTTGDRLYDKLVGCSFGVNQLVQNGDFSDGTTGWGTESATISASSNECQITKSSANDNVFGIKRSVSFLNGHVYYVTLDVKKVSGTYINGIRIRTPFLSSTRSITTSYSRLSFVYNSTANASELKMQTVLSQLTTATTEVVKVKNFQVLDLTQMFGTVIANEVYAKEQASAGSGIEWLKSYGFFTKDYYAYNAGSLVSVKPTAHKMVGKNLLPMTLDKVKAANTSGTWSGNSYTYNGVVWTLIIGLNNAVIGISAKGTATTANGSLFVVYDWSTTLLDNNTSYTLNGCPANGSASTYYLTVNNSSAVSGGNDYAIDSGSGVTFTTQASRNTVCRMVIKKDVVVNDIVFTPMLRLSDVTDATFEPYTEYTYPLTTELRGVPTLSGNDIVYDGDINEGDGTTQRKYGIVDLGSLDYSYSSTYQSFTSSAISDIGAGSGSNIYKMICAKYVTMSQSALDNATIGIAKYGSSNKLIVIKDPSYTSGSDLKTALNGVYLIFKKATTTTESSTPFTNPQICDKNGTEEYIDTRDVPIPVGHDTKYVDVPDWMENGYYKDFRQRVDETIVKKLDDSLVELQKGINKCFDIPTYATAYVDLKPYTAQNMYKCPADGIVQISINQGETGFLGFAIYPGVVIKDVYGSADHAVNDYAIVKKGMSLYHRGSANGTLKYYYNNY